MLIEDPENDGAGDDGDSGDDSDAAGDPPAKKPIVNPLIPDAGEAEGGEEEGAAEGEIPDTPEGYALPEIEGLDPEQLKTSPIVASLRAAAHKAGLPQEAFAEAIADYSERAQTQLKERTDIEIKALGDNAKQRIASLNSTLGQRLPTDLAQALASSITTAKGIEAIEKLLATGRRTTGTVAAAPPAKSRAEIEKMMADPRYAGRSQERDATFIAEIDKWWQDQAKAKK